MITVPIVDDLSVAREGMRRMLDHNETICRRRHRRRTDGSRGVAKLHPDVALMEQVGSPGNGLDITRQIKAEAAAVSIIVMTSGRGRRADDGYHPCRRQRVSA